MTLLRHSESCRRSIFSSHKSGVDSAETLQPKSTQATRETRPTLSESTPAELSGRQSFLELTLRVHVPNNQVLGFWVIVIIVQVLGKYMIIGYLDP